MPKTKSAERRMRNSERKRLHNRGTASRLRKLEKSYLALVATGPQAEAAQAFRNVCSALDKAVKAGVVHKATANRKKSRLAARLKNVK
jgi:small subunit ribosomal protein S20